MSVKTPTLVQQPVPFAPNRALGRACVIRLLGPALESVSLRVYTAFLPVSAESSDGARTYLTDLWKDAPVRGAVLHTVLALVLYFSPVVFCVAFKPLGALSSAKLSVWNQRLSQSRWYAVRLAYYAGRGHAFVAILRDERARAQILGKSK